jgi:hypothetical protein
MQSIYKLSLLLNRYEYIEFYIIIEIKGYYFRLVLISSIRFQFKP